MRELLNVKLDKRKLSQSVFRVVRKGYQYNFYKGNSIVSDSNHLEIHCLNRST